MVVDVDLNARIELDDFLDALSITEKRDVFERLRDELKDVRFEVDLAGKERVVFRDPDNAIDDVAERELTAKLEQIKDLRPKFVFKRILCNVFRIGYYEDEKLRERLEEFITAD